MKLNEDLQIKTDKGTVVLEKNENIGILFESSELLNILKSLKTSLLLVDNDKDRAKTLIKYVIDSLENYSI